MKNITLSIPDDLLAKVRQYAQRRNKSINQLIREMLASRVQSKNAVQNLIEISDRLAAVSQEKYTWNRDEIYDRQDIR